MGLYAVKPWFVRRLRRAEDALVARGASADRLTVAAVAVSVATGAALVAGGLGDRRLWLAVPPLVLARLALNALDGPVARRTGTAGPAGAALNELGDRASDVVTIGAAGVAAGAPGLGLAAVAAALAASLTGVLALALAGRRDTSGPMGKADRGAALAAGAVAGVAAGSALPLTVALWAVLAGSLVTGVLRAARLSRAPRPGAHLEEMLDVLAR